MNIMDKKISGALSFKRQCGGLPLWQCPQFIFAVMGVIIIFTVVFSYWLGTRYVIDQADPIGPYIVALTVIALALILFILAFIITQSFERLSQASRLKSEFINIISHQLRSPITNIKWVTEFLISPDIEMSPGKKEEYFKQLKDNISLMVELVDDLLIISKIEEGLFPINKKEASLRNIVGGLVSGATPYAHAKGIELNFNESKDSVAALFDASMIKLVAENLVDNAIRYTRKGGKIEIWTKKEDGKLVFKIKDQGVGIPFSDQKYIFQKFFRSSNALKEETKGSGLGLYIAKLIISKSGGKIWFESEEGKGTSFYFSIPIK
jgi:signal transduction histidine kinase